MDGTFEVPDRRLESPRIRNHYDYDAKRLNSNGEGKPSLFCVMLLSSIKKKFHSASTSFITESTPEYRRPRKLENLTEFDEDAPHATQGFTPNDSTRQLRSGSNTGEAFERGEQEQLKPSRVGSLRRLQDYRILYATSNQDNSSFRAALASITGGTVDYFNAISATPDTSLLSTYDCVFTHPNWPYDDNVLMGDRLAGFVDEGKPVVLGTFSFYSVYAIQGAITSPAYSPVVNTGAGSRYASSCYNGDGISPIHSGVTSYCSNFRDYLSLQGAGVQDASYADGEIAVAYRPDFKVISLNGVFPGWYDTNIWPLLVANACAAGSVSCQ